MFTAIARSLLMKHASKFIEVEGALRHGHAARR